MKKELGEDSYSSLNKIYVCLGPPILGPIKLVTYKLIDVIVYIKVLACLSAFGHEFSSLFFFSFEHCKFYLFFYLFL